MKTNRTRILAASISLAGLMCSAGASTAGTVTMWTFLNPQNTSGREVALKNIIEKFEAENPGITVVVEPQDWSTMSEKFVLAHSTNRAPDIIWSAQDLGLLVNSGSVTSLNPYMGDWLASQKDDLLFQNAYENATYDDSVMAVPVFPYSVIVVYRKDWFDALGLSADDMKTWDGLANAVETLTDTGKPGLLMPLSEDRPSSTVASTAFMELNGGAMIAANCEANFATDAGMKAVELEVDMLRSGMLSKEAVAQNNDDVWDLFIAGKGGIVPQVTTRLGSLLSSAEWATPETVGLAAWPSFGGERPGPAVGAAWQVSLAEGSDNKDEAAKFIQFMVSAEGAREWAVTGQQLPLRRSVAEMPELAGDIFGLNERASQIMNASAVFPTPGCTQGQSMGDWNRAVQEIFVSHADPMEMLREATSATNRRQ